MAKPPHSEKRLVQVYIMYYLWARAQLHMAWSNTPPALALTAGSWCMMKAGGSSRVSYVWSPGSAAAPAARRPGRSSVSVSLHSYWHCTFAIAYSETTRYSTCMLHLETRAYEVCTIQYILVSVSLQMSLNSLGCTNRLSIFWFSKPLKQVLHLKYIRYHVIFLWEY